MPKTNSTAFIEGQESKIVADTAAGSSMMMFDDSKMQQISKLQSKLSTKKSRSKVRSPKDEDSDVVKGSRYN